MRTPDSFLTEHVLQRKGDDTHLSLRVAGAHVGSQVETGGVHAARSLGDIGPHVGQVALRGRLHLRELASEGNHCTPQGQQAAMLRAEVLVERLEQS